MSEIVRTDDDIYKAVSGFYKSNRISKGKFINRLKNIRLIIDGDETLSEVVDWVFVQEEIEFYSTSSDAEVNKVKKTIREDFKGILSLLNIKTSRNKLIDEKEVD